MNRRRKMEQRVDRVISEQKSRRFTPRMDSAFMAFLDLALECEDLDEFKLLVVQMPKSIMGWETSLYLDDETDDIVLAETTEQQLIDRLEAGARIAITPPGGPMQCGDEYLAPLMYRGGQTLGNTDNPIGPVVGVLGLSPGDALDEKEIFFIHKYTDLVALSLAQRLLARRNQQHIDFIKKLVADIGHNVIVPNIFFKAYLRRLSGKINNLKEIHQRASELSHASPQALPSGIRDLTAELANTNEGILEEFDHIEKHYINTSLFLETLLRQSHFEKGKYVLQKKTCNFRRDIISPQMERYRPRLRERGIDVDLSMGGVPDQIIEAVVDVGLISQVFANLLSNAVKYTRRVFRDGQERKFIAYGLENIGNAFGQDRPGVKLNLFSSGIPLDAAESGRIFGEGYRGGNVEQERGTGHGLYFVKEVVELHGGQVGHEATEMGNNFYFILPI